MLLGKFLKWLIRQWQMRVNPLEYAKSLGVHLGDECRLLGLDDGTFGSEPYLIRLGHHVTVTSGVRFITHDGGVWVFRKQYPDIDFFGPIVVGDNVFIGMNVLIMPGVKIGNNCVIGAGAVVTRDIPDGQVAVGVPARCIKKVEEYWSNIESEAMHIRSMPAAEKRRKLEEKFWDNESSAGAG